jgi:hypothetical protein
MPHVKNLGLVLCLGLGGGALPAQQAPPAPSQEAVVPALDILKCRRAELKNHPFRLGPLRVSIECYRKFLLGNWLLTLKIENLTDSPQTFDPGDLAAVDANGSQQPLLLMRNFMFPRETYPIAAVPARIMPAAFLGMSFMLDNMNDLKWPVRVFLGGRQVVEVAE